MFYVLFINLLFSLRRTFFHGIELESESLAFANFWYTQPTVRSRSETLHGGISFIIVWHYSPT